MLDGVNLVINIKIEAKEALEGKSLVCEKCGQVFNTAIPAGTPTQPSSGEIHVVFDISMGKLF